jgi:DNA-binding PadR family transcriptional regulator
MIERAQGRKLEHHDLLSGLVRLHVLHHAAEHEIYGQWMIDELANHGYRLSPGTLYPMLHKMERDGYLLSREERYGRTVRKLYSITEKGKAGLALAKERVREFTGEAMRK